jgi:hypothetical protein
MSDYAKAVDRLNDEEARAAQAAAAAAARAMRGL